MSDLAHLWAAVHPVITILCIAVGIACLVNLVLRMLPMPAVKLPHPSTVPGLPMAGPASQQAAHAALSRRSQAPRPKFRT
jgi:hypothetical protein